MNKPIANNVSYSYYNYNDCKQYLQEKYGYNERDFLGKYKYIEECKNKVFEKYGNSWYKKNEYGTLTSNEKKAHLMYNELLLKSPDKCDFWNWITDKYEISNGGYIVFSYNDLNFYKKYYDIPDWASTIYEYYLKEFADEKGELRLLIEW